MHKIAVALASLVGLAALVGLVGAGIAQSSASSAQYGGPDRLFGGGRLFFDFGSGPVVRDISVQAEGRNGTNGSGTRYYGRPDAPQPVPAVTVSCLNSEDGRAVIGTIDQFGTLGVQYFRDNGPPGPDPPDEITPVLLLTPEEVATFLPKHFPRVCPSATPPPEFGNVWTTLDSGDIAVVDG
jgi:hypothetical protein